MKNDGLPSIENSDAANQDAHIATPALSTPHADSCDVVLSAMGVSRHGLSHAEAAARLGEAETLALIEALLLADTEADFDADRDADASDLAKFAGAYAANNPAVADLNGDTKVDYEDLAIFATNFGRTNCPD